MIDGRYADAIHWGHKAVTVGEHLGEGGGEAITVHALNTLGTSEIAIGRRDGWVKLKESRRRATAAGLEEAHRGGVQQPAGIRPRAKAL